MLGDLNSASLRQELPKYIQHVNCLTRGNNILDRTLKYAYQSLPQAASKSSDHCMIHPLTTYR